MKISEFTWLTGLTGPDSLKTEKSRRVRRNCNIGHLCDEIALVYLCTPAMGKKTSELMHF